MKIDSSSSCGLLLLAVSLLVVLSLNAVRGTKDAASNSGSEAGDHNARSGDRLSPSWFGALPPRYNGNLSYEMHRRGWEECLQCGGSERLGAIVPKTLVGDLREINSTGAAVLLDAVRAHGIIVVPGQNLTRPEQVGLTSALGELIVLPPSFEGQDPEPFSPAIQRITNFWANGTWKGPSAKLGAYWHQDGQFWLRPKHNILSILHAQATPPSGGETGFSDLRAARATLSGPLLERAESASIVASVRDIADFAKGTEEDLSAFPTAKHSILTNHSLDDGPLLYVGSPHMTVEGLESPEAGKALLDMILTHSTSPSFSYFHAWSTGDVIIWDNTQTLHHSMPYKNDGMVRRELYRTQCRFYDDEQGSGGEFASMQNEEF